ncbi:MAG: threonine-phosphate decarboxylase CobD [Qingshengfaniella sp.]
MTPAESPPRDHGGGIDAALLRFGGARADWLDLSTGINPRPYPCGALPGAAWTALPDQGATARLRLAARQAWSVPAGAAVLPAPGASALIARLPALAAPGHATIPGPTYNEHAAAFATNGWQITDQAGFSFSQTAADALVVVHPNNPDGRLWRAGDLPATGLTVIDESFCDIAPETSLIALAAQPGVIVLKSFGKFWGLAGLRLGFAIGDPDLLARLAAMLGPWPVSGPALEIGTRALSDSGWATQTRRRLTTDAARLDRLAAHRGLRLLGGTPLFRLYDCEAGVVHDRLARAHILTRTFPYNPRWLRLGLPDGQTQWQRLETAL